MAGWLGGSYKNVTWQRTCHPLHTVAPSLVGNVTVMKTLRLAITCLAIATSMPSVLHAQASGAGSLERTLTGNRWDVDTEKGQRAWGDIRFRAEHEFSTMNGPQGKWKVTGERTVELGIYVVEFAPGLESFVVTQKGGGKVATGKLGKATTSVPPAVPQATMLVKPASTPAAVQAPGGIPADAKPFNGKWYLVYHEPESISWDDAKQRCTTLGGQLAVVPDEPTWKFILALQNDQSSLWLGATDVESKGNWKWMDGTPFTFSRWFNGDARADHADNETYLCIDNYWPGSPWRSLPKDGNRGKTHVRGFICEWKDAPHPNKPVASVGRTVPDPLGLNQPKAVGDRPVITTTPGSVTPPVKPVMPAPTPLPVAKKQTPFPQSLWDTLWDWHDADDYVNTGGVTVIKQGAWQEMRIHPNGMANAWHGKRIVWEGKWEVVGERTVKIASGGPVGGIINFSADGNSFKVSTNRDTTGKKKGNAYLDPVIGRWHIGKEIRHVREDETAGRDGVWKRLPDGRYEFNWGNGVWIDKVTLTQDQQKLHGTNQKRSKIAWERAKE